MKVIVIFFVLASAAVADPVTLRMAAVAPDGTAWARELKAFGREVEATTAGQVKVRWYLGGIAGDEVQALARAERGQLDGLAGSVVCQQRSPSLRAVRVAGLFRSSDESRWVMAKLKADIDTELGAGGFFNLGQGQFGDDALFSRQPVRSFAEMRRMRWFVWDVDPVSQKMAAAMGLRTVPLALVDAGRAYDERRIDGFIATPTAALAFQWSAQTRYVTPLGAAMLPACMVVANRAYDALPLDGQEALRAAAAKFFVRFNDLSRRQEAELLGGLFEKQGLVQVTPSRTFVDEFVLAARGARATLGELVPATRLQEIIGWLDERRKR